MMMIYNNADLSIRRRLHGVGFEIQLKYLLLSLLFSAALLGQTNISITDSTTPPIMQVGVPSSAYALSNLDTVDPYTGAVNVHIPLLTIGGRGDVSFTLALVIQQKWQTLTHLSTNGQQTPYLYPVGLGDVTDVAGWDTHFGVKFSPGAVVSRETTDPTNGTLPCAAGSQYSSYQYFFGQLLTRLTFMDEYGTDHELVDTATDGKPVSPYAQPQCNMNPFTTGTNRGRTFRAMDSSNILFIADQDVIDQVAILKNTWLVPKSMSGWLLFPDGQKYRVDGGAISRIVDRNGNQITFNGSAITDALGRPITVTNDAITFYGFNGAQRQIVINYATLGDAKTLDANQTLQTINELFPQLTGFVNDSNYTATVPISVQLPDGSSYSFKYNSYGELVRLTLPTGGMVTYTYPSLPNVVDIEDAAGNPIGFVNHQIVSRTEYASGTAVTRTTNYSWQFDGSNTVATVVDIDGGGTTVRTVKHHYYGDASIGTDIPTPPITWYSDYWNGKEFLTETIDGNGTSLRQDQHTWTQRPCGTSEPCWFGDPTVIGGTNMPVPHDPRVCQNFTTLSDISPGLIAPTLYAYDQYNNVSDIWEYDYGAGPGPSASCQAPTSGWTRHTQTAYLTSGYDTYNVGTASPDATTAETSPYMLTLPMDKVIKDSGDNPVAEQRFAYDETTASPYSTLTGHDPARDSSSMHGNRTTLSSWLNTGSGSFLPTTRTFDINGNPQTIKDPLGNVTTLDYTDCYGADGTACQNQNTYAHVKTVTRPAVNTIQQVTSLAYDYQTGKVTGITDPNKVLTTYGYNNDPLDRLTDVDQAVNTPASTKTHYAYSNCAASQVNNISLVWTYQDQKNLGDSGSNQGNCTGLQPVTAGLLTAKEYDGLGREEADTTYEDQSIPQTVGIFTGYDWLGRTNTTENPTRFTGSSDSGLEYVTKTTFDALNRVKNVSLADTSQTNTSYSGNTATFTDVAGNTRTTTTDALGRLSAVTDATGTTLYAYDALDNLICVLQGGTSPDLTKCTVMNGQARKFVYDSLRRLTSAMNPETGTVTYAYDNNGNLLTKTDARKVITCFGSLSGTTCTSGYDALNRVTQKSYSDGTKAVNYTYDDPGVPYSIGRLTKVDNYWTIINYTAYDALGRVLSNTEQNAGQTYPFSYTYNLAGSLLTEKYPSGRVVTMTYDGANRVATITGSLGTAAKSYVSGVDNTAVCGVYNSGVCYWPHGAPASYKYGNTGNSIVPVSTYNRRLQAKSLYARTGSVVSSNYLLGLDYCWSTDIPCQDVSTTNNGNLQSATINAGGTTFTESFSYDGVSRLSSATDSSSTCVSNSTCWYQNFNHDQYGNMWVTSFGGLQGSGLTPQGPSWYNANNQLVTNAGYDAAGNQNTFGSVAINYDAEERQIRTADSQLAMNFQYDVEGRRAQKWADGGPITAYIYDILGHLAAEYDAAPATAPPACQTCYLMYDHLGSVRMVADQGGNVVSLHDYTPFGEEIYNGWGGRGSSLYGKSDNVSQRFTGKERDTDRAFEGLPALDHFGARYYGSVLGRFTSADEPLTDQLAEDPQSWNLYAYVRNNPLRNTDPRGKDCFQGASSCANYILGGIKAIANIPVALNNDFNHVINATISPITSYQFPDVPTLQPANVDQQQGMEAANAVMLVAPVAEAGAAAAADSLGTSAIEVTAGGIAPKLGEVGGPGAGKPFPASVKNAARTESNDACVFCGQPTTRTAGPDQSNIDHAIPKSLEGNNTLNNAQNTCRTCNLDKGTRTTQQYQQELRRRKEQPQ